MSEKEPATWQELLGQLITNYQMRVRLAAAVHVKPITLQRWIEGGTKPRIENIRLLLKNVPKEMYPHFRRLLVVDFPELLQDELSQEHSLQGIPTEFYARTLNNLAFTPTSIYRQSMQDLFLQQVLQHLDPDQQGLSITLALCVPPRFGRKVRSLREVTGLATPPWPRNLAGRPMFLGSESLAGYAVMHAHSYVINSRDENNLFAVQWTEYEESAAVFPILFRARIVGGLIFSSARKHFFTSPRLAVIEDYAHLAACIFEPEESFDFNEIELGIMPSHASQYPYFTDYNQRVSRKVLEANAVGNQITLHRARELVWQDLEDILLEVPME